MHANLDSLLDYVHCLLKLDDPTKRPEVARGRQEQAVGCLYLPITLLRLIEV